MALVLVTLRAVSLEEPPDPPMVRPKAPAPPETSTEWLWLVVMVVLLELSMDWLVTEEPESVREKLPYKTGVILFFSKSDVSSR